MVVEFTYRINLVAKIDSICNCCYYYYYSAPSTWVENISSMCCYSIIYCYPKHLFLCYPRCTSIAKYSRVTHLRGPTTRRVSGSTLLRKNNSRKSSELLFHSMENIRSHPSSKDVLPTLCLRWICRDFLYFFLDETDYFTINTNAGSFFSPITFSRRVFDVQLLFSRRIIRQLNGIQKSIIVIKHNQNISKYPKRTVKLINWHVSNRIESPR